MQGAPANQGAAATFDAAAAAAFRLTLVTRDPRIAAAADAAGVDRIGIDLETWGKKNRQAGIATWFSDHRLEDLPRIGERLGRSQLFVRINPPEGGGEAELEQALRLGARVVMLPMFRGSEDARRFLQRVDGRAWPVLLLERAEAVRDLDRLLAIDRPFEVHVGLNDLAISLGHRQPFAILADPALHRVCDAIRASGRVLLSVGRLARPDDRSLPVPPALMCRLLVQLGAGGAFLSQHFLRDGDPGDADWMRAAVAGLRACIGEAASAGEAARDAVREQIAAALRAFRG